MAEENKTPENEEINYTTNTFPSGEDSAPTAKIEDPAPSSEINEEFIKPKKNLIFKILIGVVSALILFIIIGAILYFIGFFEHKEEAPSQQVEPPHIETVQHVEKVETKEDSYKFNIKDINSKKLNDQLANLTNKNINIEKKENEKKLLEEEKKKKEEEELAKQKIELEEKRLELEKQKALLEEIKKQESTVKNEVTPQPEAAKNTNLEEKNQSKEVLNNNPSQEVVTKPTQPNDNKNEFLLFINVAKIKGVLYKKYLDKIVAINPNVKLCRDEKNRIEIYFGPFENSEERAKILNKLLDKKFNEAYELEFTKEEFDKRCNY
jgi:hypothetical protein